MVFFPASTSCLYHYSLALKDHFSRKFQSNLHEDKSPDYASPLLLSLLSSPAYFFSLTKERLNKSSFLLLPTSNFHPFKIKFLQSEFITEEEEEDELKKRYVHFNITFYIIGRAAKLF